MIVTTLAAVPDRTRVLLAKATALVALLRAGNSCSDTRGCRGRRFGVPAVSRASRRSR